MRIRIESGLAVTYYAVFPCSDRDTGVAREGAGAYILRGTMKFVLKILSPRFTVARLAPGAALPPWSLTGQFCSITRTENELSIVCESVQVPDGLCSESDWRALEVQGPLQFDQVGILAALSQVLADHGVSIFAVSTYDTDYILLKNTGLSVAVDALEQAGHQVIA